MPATGLLQGCWSLLVMDTTVHWTTMSPNQHTLGMKAPTEQSHRLPAPRAVL